MSPRSGEQPADTNVEPVASDVQYVLVGSLVGAILLLIVYAIYAAH
jgi:hypothetical protein